MIVVTAHAEWFHTTGGTCTCAYFQYLKQCPHVEAAKAMAIVRGSVGSIHIEEKVVR